VEPLRLTGEVVTVEEIRRIRDLSVALIEALQLSLQAIASYSMQQGVPLPSNIRYLVNEATRLIRDFNQPYISDGWKQSKPSDEEGTKPLPSFSLL